MVKQFSVHGRNLLHGMGIPVATVTRIPPATGLESRRRGRRDHGRRRTTGAVSFRPAPEHLPPTLLVVNGRRCALRMNSVSI